MNWILGSGAVFSLAFHATQKLMMCSIRIELGGSLQGSVPEFNRCFQREFVYNSDEVPDRARSLRVGELGLSEEVLRERLVGVTTDGASAKMEELDTFVEKLVFVYGPFLHFRCYAQMFELAFEEAEA